MSRHREIAQIANDRALLGKAGRSERLSADALSMQRSGSVAGAGSTGFVPDSYETLVTTLPGGAPTSFWRCQSATQFTDVRPALNHGTYVGGAPTVVGGLPTGAGGALAFPGDRYVTVPHIAAYVSTTAAIMVWIQDAGASAGTNRIWGKDHPSIRDGDIWLEYDAIDDLLTLSCRQLVGAVNTRFDLSTPFSLSTKNCVIVNLPSTGAELWVNGQQRGVITGYTQGLPTLPEPQPLLFMAAQDTPTAGTKAILDECAIWPRVLTSANIIALSQQTAPPTILPMSDTIEEGAVTTFDVLANSTWVGSPTDGTITVTVSATSGGTYASTATIGVHSASVNPTTRVVTFTAGAVTADTIQPFYVRVTDVTGSGDGTITVTITDIPTATTYYDDMFSIGGAVALYRMNTTGTNIPDSSGNNRTGTWTPTAPTLSTTDLPCAGTTGSLTLNGTKRGSVPSSANNVAFSTLNATIVAFFKVPNTNREQIIFGRDANGNEEGDINFRVQAGPTIVTAHQKTGGGHKNLNISGIALNRWYHVAQTVSAEGYELWLDGRLWGSTIGDPGPPGGSNIISGFTLNTEPIMWGWLPWAAATGEDAFCSLGPWAQYNKVLTPAQIIDLCPHVGLPQLTGIPSITMDEGTSRVIPLDNFDPQYVGKRVPQSSTGGIDLTIGNANPTVFKASQLGNRDILLESFTGSGLKTFTVQLQDRKGNSNTVTVSVDVDPVVVPGPDDLTDAYGLIAKNTVGNVIFALRLKDAPASTTTPPGQAADSYTGGWHGNYVNTGGVSVPGIAFSSTKTAFKTNGAAYVERNHNTTLAPAAGAFSAWFQIQTTAASACIANKGANFEITAVQGGADAGRIRLTWGGGVIQTPPGYTELGVRNHVFVAWGAGDVRFYVDGMLIGGRNSGGGLSLNTAPWQFGRTSGGAITNIVLHEIYLFGTAQKTFAHATAMAEGQRGLAYRAATRTVNVPAQMSLNAAIAEANTGGEAGTHYVVAAGTYNNPPNITAGNKGTNRNQVVFRSATAGAATIAGGWDILGNWVVIDGFNVTAETGSIRLFGSRSRLTRIVRANNFDGNAFELNGDNGGRFCRLDHCSTGPPGQDSGGGVTNNAPIEANPRGGPGLKFALIDHFYTTAPNVNLGNGRDGIRIGSTAGDTDTSTYTTVYRSYFDNYDADEIVSGKSADIFFWYCTVKRGVRSAADYSQDRHSYRHQWRSCAWVSSNHWVLGDNHHLIGCLFNDSILRVQSGNMDMDTFPNLPGGGTTGNPRPASRGLLIEDCQFTNGSNILGSSTPGAVEATTTVARGNTGFTWNVPAAEHNPNTVTNTVSIGTWHEDAVAFTAANQVGRGAADPLVPTGLF